MKRVTVENLGPDAMINGRKHTRRRLRVTLDLDLTGHGQISEQRLEQLGLTLVPFVETSAKTIGLGDVTVVGSMEYFCGPTHMVGITGPENPGS